MIFYLKAKVIKIAAQEIIIENNNYGYLIFVTNPSNYNINQDIIIYIYLYRTQFNDTYYGFNEIDEYYFFINLLKVNGIGPKKALNILKNNNYQILNKMIVQDQFEKLQDIKEIGSKLAGQILFKMKDKYLKLTWTHKQKNLFIALKKLGYEQSIIKQMVNDIDDNLSLSVLLAQILEKIHY